MNQPDLYDEDADYDRSERVEDTPGVTQENSTADSEHRADGREGIGAMVPRVRNDDLALHFPSDEACVLVERLLGKDRDGGRDECNHPWAFELLPFEEMPIDGADAAPEETESDEEEEQTDDTGR